MRMEIPDTFRRLVLRPKSLLFAIALAIVSLVLYAAPNHTIDYGSISAPSAIFGSKWYSTDTAKRRAISNKLEELEAQFGRRFFQKSVAYSGTNHRLHVALRKVLSGQPFKVGYLGGSVSAGANIHGDAAHLLWPVQLLRVLNETLPHLANEVAGRAQGGSGSEYFSWCGAGELHDGAEIILLEHSVNNIALPGHGLAFYDSEIRGMLSRPTRPAVIGIEFFQLWDSLTQGGGMAANHVCRYYDAPYLSLKNPLLPELIAHPNRVTEFFGMEGVDSTGTFEYNFGHVNTRGHWAMAALIAHHILSQALVVLQEGLDDSSEARHPLDRYIPGDPAIGGRHPLAEFEANVQAIEAWQTENLWGQELVYTDLPRLSLSDWWSFDRVVHPAKPHCLDAADPRFVFENVVLGKKTTEDGTVTDEEGTGWEIWKSPLSKLEKWYLRTDSYGAVVRVKIAITGQGDVQVDYLRSETYGLGTAKCWWEGDEGRSYTMVGRREGAWSTGDTVLVAEGLQPGDHWLLCEMIEGKDFRIISIQTR